MMRKHILFILLYCSIASSTLAQKDYRLQKNQVLITAGYGFPSVLRFVLKLKTNREDFFIKGAGPFIFKAEYMASKRIGVGLNASYNYSVLYWYDTGYDTIQKNYHDFEFGIQGRELSGAIRVNYHFLQKSKFDMYGGIGIGTGIINLHSYSKAHTVNINLDYELPRPYYFDATVGARYFFTKNIGLYSELGLGKSWLLYKKYFVPEAIIQGGLSLRL
ncbi:MAG: hypothetical protein R2831_06440 [Chitinophagaceae bacterium]